MKYQCKCKTFEVHKTTIKVVDGKVVKPETYCNECNTYGEYIKEHKGYGGIIKKPNGTIAKRSDLNM
jgi:hypothetical protein